MFWDIIGLIVIGFVIILFGFWMPGTISVLIGFVAVGLMWGWVLSRTFVKDSTAARRAVNAIFMVFIGISVLTLFFVWLYRVFEPRTRITREAAERAMLEQDLKRGASIDPFMLEAEAGLYNHLKEVSDALSRSDGRKFSLLQERMLTPHGVNEKRLWEETTRIKQHILDSRAEAEKIKAGLFTKQEAQEDQKSRLATEARLALLGGILLLGVFALSAVSAKVAIPGWSKSFLGFAAVVLLTIGAALWIFPEVKAEARNLEWDMVFPQILPVSSAGTLTGAFAMKPALPICDGSVSHNLRAIEVEQIKHHGQGMHCLGNQYTVPDAWPSYMVESEVPGMPLCVFFEECGMACAAQQGEETYVDTARCRTFRVASSGATIARPT